ncbi:DUF1599 domain-containing protein [Flammeovirgaceae bacterium SG7u.111]|nr:DUF1599 domain-containing protein [Flammeovirgaceae bacterium SG7u.132]WPO37785.1 DUF1599 domain-containing protein [Flammeovirgaceae bacterium SG7u.111]
MSKPDTASQYKEVTASCRELFEKKTRDYGTAWRILRLSSITDQIFIKANRIRSIQEKGTQKIEEDIHSEFIAIINYCLIAMMQIELTDADPMELNPDDVMEKYDGFVEETMNLMLNKNHDYGEAWRLMRVSSITDIILMKILRVKQIEENKGKTLVSEGVKANYQDMLNYAVFCLILLGEQV